MYIDALVKNINFKVENTEVDESEVDDNQVREQLLAEHKLKGNEWAHHLLRQLDPVSAEQIHPNNVKRVIRALEVTIRSGVPFSQHKKDAVANPSKLDFDLFCLEFPREVLYKRINERVDLMFANGLIEEAKKLYDNMLFDSKTAAQAIGYKELTAYFLGNNSIEEVKERIKMETRRYAKRQSTWFKRYSHANVIDCINQSPKENALKISHLLSCYEK